MYYRYFRKSIIARPQKVLLSKKNLLQKSRNAEEGAISEASENSSRKLARQDVSEAVKEIGSANIERENNGVDKVGI